jgi:Xaa-Pro aminopeptidase
MIRRVAFVLLALTFVLPVCGSSIGATAWRSGTDAASTWQTAPRAPSISESDRLAELGRRRAEVMKRVGEKAVLVLFSAVPRVYTNDVDYPFRQENNLYYLTGIKQAGATLVLIPGARKIREILFLPRPDPRAETWTGHMLTAEEARARSGIQEIWDDATFSNLLGFIAPRGRDGAARRSEPARDDNRSREWREDFKTLSEAISNGEGELYLLLPSPSERESREYRLEQNLAAQTASSANGLAVKNAWPIFSELRLRKSQWELSLLQHAVDITAEAFQRAYALAAPGVHEYEVQAEFEYTFRRRNADNWGYPCIVGAGTNATTLHYITNQDSLRVGDLLLMDCAAEYDHYSADVTRTIPISGKFTKEQAEIYRIVYDAQMEAIKLARPGNLMTSRGAEKSVHSRAVEVVKEGLLRLGLITSKTNDEYRTWFMHGTSHWIGMNVHDVGKGSTPLEPGMVFTVEPGIYIRPDALEALPKTAENERFIAAVRPAFEKYKGVGVRIEDDVQVTTGDPKVMSSAVPSKLEEVEATMARLKQASGPPRADAR